jgi:hypothetical protein
MFKTDAIDVRTHDDTGNGSLAVSSRFFEHWATMFENTLTALFLDRIGKRVEEGGTVAEAIGDTSTVSGK